MSYYVWVGPRESDCIFSDLFSDSICYFTDKNPQAIRMLHIYDPSYKQFIIKEMNRILKDHSDAAFIFYNPKIAYNIPAELRSKVKCLNTKYLLELLSDKIYTRFWLAGHVPVLPSRLLESQSLTFQTLEEKVCPSEHYVVQQNKNSGGFGTYYVSKENTVLSELKNKTKEVFIVSPYKEKSISVNVNVIIFKETEAIFEPSLQIVLHDEAQLLYHGADFIALQKMSPKRKAKIVEYSMKIVQKLRGLGFLGILGIDYLMTEEVYFLEINPRFQASGFLIDKALKECNYPSLAEMNLASFFKQDDNSIIPSVNNMSIPYSFYKYLYTPNSKHNIHVYERANANPYVEKICTDGWNIETPAEPKAYCYSLIFNTNITSLNSDASFDIYSNIPGDKEFIDKNQNERIFSYKIALLNQGCSISPNALKVLQEKGTIKHAVFHAIDFYCFHGIPVNSPVNLKFTDFSPFTVCSDESDNLQLQYYGSVISNIDIELKPDWSEYITSSGIAYERIAYLSTDRLRLKHEGVCYFKLQEKGCYFCNIPKSNIVIKNSDLEEVIKNLVYAPSFRHILIGGGSGNPETEYKQIEFIAQTIRQVNSQIPIYLMSLPPNNLQILDLYYQVGISEISFNIEVFNRQTAKRIMPGKGNIPLERYLEALEYGARLWGKTGNVRTALIVGLNDTASLLDGIELLCQKGIQPMLSVFRPLPNTRLEWMVPPSNQVLMDVYNKAQKICHSHQLTLGPSCDACKNNMLAL
ncbi:radical SAM protein [Faecalicatena orotica]|uniref:ATP-grasp domain-containing protein n=1 Tax=Faecalicatena orotica TaxID=1544 RepID=A0A2Y9BIN9_9FIRM|nr:radical SAM protein [Faecalicatena orotica]PWJ23145.1 ATP-grasp domain-containing protein [Faecalicatena orotica]SSA57882.1 ATP-grasp domain-containing protein [Faecalicatena orotica]